MEDKEQLLIRAGLAALDLVEARRRVQTERANCTIALRRWKLARGIGLDEFIRADDPAWREMQEATSAARTQLKRAKMDAFNALRRMERVARMAGRLNRPTSW